jgi:hypothetical protein
MAKVNYDDPETAGGTWPVPTHGHRQHERWKRTNRSKLDHWWFASFPRTKRQQKARKGAGEMDTTYAAKKDDGYTPKAL